MTAASHRRARWLAVVVVLVGAGAVLAAIAYWPRGEAPDLGTQSRTYVDATVRSVQDDTCDDPDTGDAEPCRVVTARLTTGSDEGDTVRFRVLDTQTGVPDLAEGDKVVLHVTEGAPAAYRYSFADLHRTEPLWWLAGGFVAVLLFFGRGRGLRAL
ncbi:MAG TPA: hypothetical protein VH479_10090, partial [Acidimicrobiales bacterium]